MDNQISAIQATMVECGLSAEAAAKICESITLHIGQHKQQLQEEYNQRIAKAKKVCVEETDQYKLELSRRLQVFLEAKSTTIDRRLTQQITARDTDATQLLAQLRGLMEGIPVDANNKNLQEQINTLKDTNTKLVSENRQMTIKANRLSQLTEKVLSRNRILETKVAGKSIQSEGIKTPTTTIAEGTATRALVRQRGQSKTVRPTIMENQDPNPPVDRRISTTRASVMPNAVLTPSQIAESIENL